ncbi:hypothetical protein ACWCIB_11685 [SAR92 clade bacterium H246]
MAKSVTSSYLSLDLFKYAVTGVAEKILKILIFFIPLRLYLALHGSDKIVVPQVFRDFDFVIGLAIVFVVIGGKMLVSSRRNDIGLNLKVAATLDLNKRGLLSHIKTPNSKSNSVVALDELRIVTTTYFVLLTVMSFLLAGWGWFVILPFLSFCFLILLSSFFSKTVWRVRYFIFIMYFFLVSYIYVGSSLLGAIEILKADFLYLLFSFFVFRFFVDASNLMCESRFKVEQMLRGEDA